MAEAMVLVVARRLYTTVAPLYSISHTLAHLLQKSIVDMDMAARNWWPKGLKSLFQQRNQAADGEKMWRKGSGILYGIKACFCGYDCGKDSLLNLPFLALKSSVSVCSDC